MRHLFGHQRLGRDRCICRSATHGEVVADDHHRPAIDLAAPEHAIGGRQVCQFAAGVILGDTGYGPNFVERVPIEQFIDAFTDVKPALIALAFDLVSAAHLPREGFAPGEFVEFRLPVHSYPPP